MTIPSRSVFKRRKRASDEHDEKSTSQQQPASHITPSLFVSSVANRSLAKIMASNDEFFQLAQQCYQTTLAIKATNKARAWVETHHSDASGNQTEFAKLGQTVRYLDWCHDPDRESFRCTFVIGYPGSRVMLSVHSYRMSMISTSSIPPWELLDIEEWTKLAGYLGLTTRHPSPHVLAQLLQRMNNPQMELPEQAEPWENDWEDLEEGQQEYIQQLHKQLQHANQPVPQPTARPQPQPHIPEGVVSSVHVTVNGTVRLNDVEVDRVYDW